MITKSKIDSYLDTIPPIPETIKRTLLYLDESDLVQAANIASKDRAFCLYLSSIVNKSIFGFRDEVKNINQIFGILGLKRARQIIFCYYLQIIAPKDWKVFKFSNKKFQEFQANLMILWERVLERLGVQDRDMEHSITLIPASLIVCEMLFRDIDDTISLLRETKQISYDEILYKMSGYRLFDIVEMIAIKWNFPEDIAIFIRDTFENKLETKEAINLKLLLSYEMSKPYMIESGLNDFFDFDMDFKERDILFFAEIVEAGE